MGLAPATLEIIIPVFGVVALGYAVGFFGWMRAEATRGLSIYVFNIAIPLLLFRAMSTVALPDAVPWQFLAVYYGCAFAVFFLALWAERMRAKRSVAESAIFAFGSSYGNFIPLGIPLVLTAFGDEATVPLFALVAFQAPLFFAVMIVIQEMARHQVRQSRVSGSVLRSAFANQYLLGIGLGLLVNLSGFSLPAPIEDGIGLIGQSAVPCALFALGASLSQYPLGGVLPRVMMMVLLKNILLPLAVWAATLALHLPPLWQAVVVVMAALPIGINTYLFAERYETGQALAGTSVVISTAVSILTLSVVFSLLATA